MSDGVIRKCGRCGVMLPSGYLHDYCMHCIQGAQSYAPHPLHSGPEPKPKDEGRKNDEGKLPVHLIAPEIIAALGQVLQFGAEKYEPRNWERGMDWSRVWSATQRHLWAFWEGEANDPETGYSHLAHAACCIMFLLAYEDRRIGNDDRPSSEKK